ncbi:hypothetical protein GRF59_14475 [Paenibacillus sp. HJL G12]|uniref:Uncharacterized protein n=1 Tax=Paenibacillus dendrobii TaxID=2691084 RepID=A0A7X3IIX8_9BACL|nr:hypothetical protein [Paenibacillus dendrobii]MWV44823.1 hypothetical protein [Paenibacillus dendrobii]
MGLKDTMQYIEENKKEYIKKKKMFVCDQCLKERDIDLKAPYTSEDEDLVFCQLCIKEYHETGKW